jgi:hypothetical protein
MWIILSLYQGLIAIVVKNVEVPIEYLTIQNTNTCMKNAHFPNIHLKSKLKMNKKMIIIIVLPDPHEFLMTGRRQDVVDGRWVVIVGDLVNGKLPVLKIPDVQSEMV